MIPCRECGKDSGWTMELVNQPLFGGNVDVAVCDSCCNEYHEKESEEKTEYKEFSQEPLTKLIRPLYLETEYNLLPKQAQTVWKNMKYWTPELGKGLYLLGASRQGKSRLLMMLLKQLHDEGHCFKVFYAGEFHAQLAEAKRSAFYKSWRDEVVNIPILAIDDLFAEKMTPTSEAGLFEVVNQRMERKLPILCTSQVKRSDAVDRFDDKSRGQAFMNRLKETSQLYVFNQDVLQEVAKL